ncbi:hypothetical protein B0H17DRAFT_1196255 [Mycena rosella]|uniref:Uncharacterized protein n=1 Tax=Mycena rosella TaxID=1033263 RepID=A0AAD7GNR7_MYCRO|nr:hypothetical protein B0H17DRAFT_1196255 [Mycena rosella]
MLSTIFVLALSALSMVDASSTKSSSDACGVGLANCNPPLKPLGLYQIYQPARGVYLYKYVLNANPGGEGPLQVQKPSGHENYLPMWWVREVGKDRFNLEPYGSPGVHAAAHFPSPFDAPGSNLVFASLTSYPLVSTWAIESAGNELWTIKVPNYNAVWKSNSTMISLEPADGTPDEHWELQYYGGP